VFLAGEVAARPDNGRVTAPRVLTIAGSDPSGGAGVHADLAVFATFGCAGQAVIAALTAQSSRGVLSMRAVDADFVATQLAGVFEDGAPAAAKTGMLPTGDVVRAVAAAFAARPGVALVVDPVFVSGDGVALCDAAAVQSTGDALAPISALLTPNAAEVSVLAAVPVTDVDSAISAARRLLARGCRAVLVKGGHLSETHAIDVLVVGHGEPTLFRRPRIATARRVHGTGCALSAAIVAGLAHGLALRDAVRIAGDYVHAAIARSGPRGAGAFFLDHSVRVAGMVPAPPAPPAPDSVARGGAGEPPPHGSAR
jgi:hydroxymethylpyrimidine/phosphomethylpyrimidine kinase